MEPQALLSSPVDELQPHLSHDDRWLAYVSNETGRNEVYVRRYPELTEKWQISNQGGTEPVWSPDSYELFYRQGQKIMIVEMGEQDLSPSRPRKLLEVNIAVDSPYGRSYDVAPDSQGFVFVERSDIRDADYQLRVILDWLPEVESLLAAK